MPVRLLVLAVGLAALWGGCRHAPTDAEAEAAAEAARPVSETWGARLTTTADGRPSLRIEAPYLARYADSAQVVLGPPPGADSAARVRVQLFAEDGAPQATIEAARAQLDERERRLVADGRVRATLPDATVEAPRLASAGEAFTATGGAVVQLSGATAARVRARRVEGRPGRYEASGGVVVESGGRTLRSERVVWDEGAGRFAAPGAFSFDGAGESVRGVDLSATSDLSRYSFRRATGQIEVRE